MRSCCCSGDFELARRAVGRPAVDPNRDQFVDDEVLAHEDAKLESKYPEFRMLMKEYRDGILLFELTDQKVWSKAVKDSTGLQAYYDQHSTEHMYPTRFDVDVYTCATAEAGKRARDLHAKGRRGQEVADALNAKTAGAVAVEGGLFSEEEKPALKGVTKPGLTPDQVAGGRVIFMDVKRVVPPAPKPLAEVRGLVTAAYQDQLEKEWIKELRNRYAVTVNKDILYSIH